MQEEIPQAQSRRFFPAPLVVLSVLSALAALAEAASFFYARAHLKEIFRDGSVAILGGRAYLTESAAQANPHLVAAVFCVLLSAACIVGANWLRRRHVADGGPRHSA